MTKTYKYKGVLAEPMSDHLWLVAALSKRQADAEKASIEHSRQLQERLIALVSDCGVTADSKDPIFETLLRLAERHVPAFSTQKRSRRGQPSKSPLRHLRMVMLVDEQIAKDRRVSESIRTVAKVLGRRGEEAAIERDYRRFKKWDADVMSKARQEFDKQ